MVLVDLAEGDGLVGKGGAIAVVVGLEVGVNFLGREGAGDDPDLADPAAAGHRQADWLALGRVAERADDPGGGGVAISVDEGSIDVEMLVPRLVLDDDELAPGVQRHVIDSDVRERQSAVAEDRGQEEAVGVGAEDEVHPIVAGPEDSLAAGGDLGHAPRHEPLLAGRLREEPAADGQRLDAVGLVGDRLDGRAANAFHRASIASAVGTPE